MKIRLVKTSDAGFKPLMAKILGRRGTRAGDVEQRVEEIVTTVQRQGDRAVLRYTAQFDHVRLRAAQMEVTPAQIASAVAKVSRKDLSILRLAAKRIAAFHRRQMLKSWQYRDPWAWCWDNAYAPRTGRFTYPAEGVLSSTVLMNAIPAKVAGVKEIVMTSPSARRRDYSRCAHVAGVDRIFRRRRRPGHRRVGVRHTDVPKSTRCRAGKYLVATAKRMVLASHIDSIAGPSEILLLADDSADPAHVAADMLSQAEHDELAAAVCLTTSKAVALKVQKAVEQQLLSTKRQAISLRSLQKYGAIIVAREQKEMIELANAIAPEHIELLVRQPEKMARQIATPGRCFSVLIQRRPWAIIWPDLIMCCPPAAARGFFRPSVPMIFSSARRSSTPSGAA